MAIEFNDVDIIDSLDLNRKNERLEIYRAINRLDNILDGELDVKLEPLELTELDNLIKLANNPLFKQENVNVDFRNQVDDVIEEIRRIQYKIRPFYENLSISINTNRGGIRSDVTRNYIYASLQSFKRDIENLRGNVRLVKKSYSYIVQQYGSINSNVIKLANGDDSVKDLYRQFLQVNIKRIFLEKKIIETRRKLNITNTDLSFQQFIKFHENELSDHIRKLNNKNITFDEIDKITNKLSINDNIDPSVRRSIKANPFNDIKRTFGNFIDQLEVFNDRNINGQFFLDERNNIKLSVNSRGKELYNLSGIPAIFKNIALQNNNFKQLGISSQKSIFNSNFRSLFSIYPEGSIEDKRFSSNKLKTYDYDLGISGFSDLQGEISATSLPDQDIGRRSASISQDINDLENYLREYDDVIDPADRKRVDTQINRLRARKKQLISGAEVFNDVNDINYFHYKNIVLKTNFAERFGLFQPFNIKSRNITGNVRFDLARISFNEKDQFSLSDGTFYSNRQDNIKLPGFISTYSDNLGSIKGLGNVDALFGKEFAEKNIYGIFNTIKGNVGNGFYKKFLGEFDLKYGSNLGEVFNQKYQSQNTFYNEVISNLVDNKGFTYKQIYGDVYNLSKKYFGDIDNFFSVRGDSFFIKKGIFPTVRLNESSGFGRSYLSREIAKDLYGSISGSNISDKDKFVGLLQRLSDDRRGGSFIKKELDKQNLIKTFSLEGFYKKIVDTKIDFKYAINEISNLRDRFDFFNTSRGLSVDDINILNRLTFGGRFSLGVINQNDYSILNRLISKEGNYLKYSHNEDDRFLKLNKLKTNNILSDNFYLLNKDNSVFYDFLKNVVDNDGTLDGTELDITKKGSFLKNVIANAISNENKNINDSGLLIDKVDLIIKRPPFKQENKGLMVEINGAVYDKLFRGDNGKEMYALLTRYPTKRGKYNFISVKVKKNDAVGANDLRAIDKRISGLLTGDYDGDTVELSLPSSKKDSTSIQGYLKQLHSELDKDIDFSIDDADNQLDKKDIIDEEVSSKISDIESVNKLKADSKREGSKQIAQTVNALKSFSNSLKNISADKSLKNKVDKAFDFLNQAQEKFKHSKDVGVINDSLRSLDIFDNVSQDYGIDDEVRNTRIYRNYSRLRDKINSNLSEGSNKAHILELFPNEEDGNLFKHFLRNGSKALDEPLYRNVLSSDTLKIDKNNVNSSLYDLALSSSNRKYVTLPTNLNRSLSEDFSFGKGLIDRTESFYNFVKDENNKDLINFYDSIAGHDIIGNAKKKILNKRNVAGFLGGLLAVSSVSSSYNNVQLEYEKKLRNDLDKALDKAKNPNIIYNRSYQPVEYQRF